MPGTVTVACKHPSGLELRLHVKKKVSMPVMGGGTKEVDEWQATGQVLSVRGPAHPFDKAPTIQILGGYALTQNIDADLFKAWMEQNAESGLVKNRIIFAHSKQDMVEGQAKEQEEIRSGMERIDPNKLPKGIETATRV